MHVADFILYIMAFGKKRNHLEMRGYDITGSTRMVIRENYIRKKEANHNYSGGKMNAQPEFSVLKSIWKSCCTCNVIVQLELSGFIHFLMFWKIVTLQRGPFARKYNVFCFGLEKNITK